MRNKKPFNHCNLHKKFFLEHDAHSPMSRFFIKNERKILKALLLSELHQLLCDIFQNTTHQEQNDFLKECYNMDNSVMQFLIYCIVETGQYTLEGIAYDTRIPFDVIYDAACGKCHQLSITPWSRIANLFIKVKPEIAQLLFERLRKTKDEKAEMLSLLIQN